MIEAKGTEKIVLGLLLDQPQILVQNPGIRPDLFTGERYVLASAIKSLHELGMNHDAASVSNWMSTHGSHEVLDSLGGREGLLDLQTDIPYGAYNFAAYLEELEEKFNYREVERLGKKLSSVELEHGNQPSAEYIGNIQERLIGISQKHSGIASFSNFDDATSELLAELVDLASKPPGTLNGLSTGYRDIDAYLLGLRENQLITIAARPAIGKTSFALCIASHIAFDCKEPVVFFSLEMSKRELTQRVISFRSRVPHKKILTGRMSENDWAGVAKATQELKNSPFYLDDNTGVKITDIRNRCAWVKSEHGKVGAVFVDYLQLMAGDGNEYNRTAVISEISRGLKLISGEFQCPVIALSQLNRNLESRPNKRPILSDLRESGCLTADTRVLLADGSSIEIGAIQKDGLKNLSVFSLDESTQQFVTDNMTHAFSTGVKDIYEMTLDSGEVLKVTANHKIKTYGGYTRLEDLRVGDFVHTPRTLDIGSKKETLSDDEVVLLAHLLGDGCVGVGRRTTYCTQDKANGEAVEAAAKAHLGAEVVWDWNGHSNCWQIRITSNITNFFKNRTPAAIWLESLGLWGKRSKEKFVPEKIMGEMSDRQIKLFLRHIWSTDGSVFLKNGRNRVYYATGSRLLADQIKTLLSSQGIISRICKVGQGEYDPQFHVDVTGVPNLTTFLTDIGCHGSRGDITPEYLSYLSTIKGNPNKDIYPPEIWADIKMALFEQKISHRSAAASMEEQYCGSYFTGGSANTNGKKRGLSRNRAMKFDKLLGSDIELSTQLNANVQWSQINSIEYIGQEEVFDATVEGNHNFIANGIVVHNSIEQDSSVVLGLYRDEVYHPGTGDQGISEVDILKNRSGGRGVIRLAFFNNYASFMNLAETK